MKLTDNNYKVEESIKKSSKGSSQAGRRKEKSKKNEMEKRNYHKI